VGMNTMNELSKNREKIAGAQSKVGCLGLESLQYIYTQFDSLTMS
jgi:hypothetical protein